ncbi:cytochrome b-c1 complex subunit 7 [Boletus reticuloceps]|uniref:Cytochrome b-c1 complex subunit 7 n=1 Tax=Boletus reticuloceps TaxID=495285 RepID=A0A8I2YNB7_9AGAM|nr:cytochrome b-c1 complex subunit 7 [Boletus reticuloceps]
MNALGPSLAPYVRSSRSLKTFVTPIAHWYAGLMGYRRMGLKYDDLQMEELPEVQRALGRLTPREAYDRAYRMKLALHASVMHKDLPKDQWVSIKDVCITLSVLGPSPTLSQDVRYLKPHIESVLQEDEERAVWDNMAVHRK